nr:MAG TPA: hypothetical protein [Caudoviricetes sp.]
MYNNTRAQEVLKEVSTSVIWRKVKRTPWR